MLAGLLAVSCTSTRINDVTASSTHVSTTLQTPDEEQPDLDKKHEQAMVEEKRSPSFVRDDTANNKNTPLLQDSVKYSEPARSISTPAQADKQTNIASLNTDSTSVFAEEKETQALQRVNILDAQMKHETCKGGWATQPDKLDSSRITAGHPFYMEMRLRHTPMLPVGHTYIAYGRLSPSGQPLEERLVMLSPVGGYGGAAIAAAMPMPGVLKPIGDDCRLKPIAAYRITLTAQQYEQLLLRIQQARTKVPSYLLFAYNCNHFASDIAAAVGILPPKNKYLPALKYIYGVIEANEGYNPKGKLPT